MRTRSRAIAVQISCVCGSDHSVEAVNDLGRLVEYAGFDEPQAGAEIGHILGVSSGQFSVVILSRLAPVSLPRLDALSELLKVTVTDLPGWVRSGCGDHGHPWYYYRANQRG